MSIYRTSWVSTGSASTLKCNAGYHIKSSERRNLGTEVRYLCEKCDYGKFSPISRAKWHCDLCPKGTFSSSVGSTQCMDCQKGYYNNSHENRNCSNNKCPPGTNNLFKVLIIDFGSLTCSIT